MLSPDLILHGGKVITLDRSSRVTQAVAVRSGHIAAVGDDAALCKEAAPATRLIDLAGRSVLPGFFDAHPHDAEDQRQPDPQQRVGAAKDGGVHEVLEELVHLPVAGVDAARPRCCRI